jgi:glucose/arabinose dehydrogenase
MPMKRLFLAAVPAAPSQSFRQRAGRDGSRYITYDANGRIWRVMDQGK